MENDMRKYLAIAAISVATLSSSAALAQWQNPYVHREQNGD